MAAQRRLPGGREESITAIEIFQKNHRTNRKALVSLDRALLMQGGNWSIAAKNLANYLDIEHWLPSS